MITTAHTYDGTGTIVETVEYDSDVHTVTITPPGTSRPMTAEEIEYFDQRVADIGIVANTATLNDEIGDRIVDLLGAVAALNEITARTNATINANPAVAVKDVARELKTVARQTIRIARIVSGSTESTDSGS